MTRCVLLSERDGSRTVVTSPNPVLYAENVLGVHRVHEEAQAILVVLDTARRRVAEVGQFLRAKREELADAEADVTVSARAENVAMSDTAFQRHLRILLQRDTGLTCIRQEILVLQVQHDEADSDARLADRSLDIAVARLHELGGLCSFYGLTRQQLTH